ncbi:HIT domain-containing protein [Camelliibacillus cellulosilyticus]|uniref:HIT domain-containing protein n=1 Tax=Camelliibacillus cellulosilyticus TaxID=2174486 RepID=A0ABV9GMG1_9BACL
MSHDYYCDKVLSGKTPVKVVKETDRVLAFYHTRPSYPVHIVAIPKKHVPSLTMIEQSDHDLLLELLLVIKEIARLVETEYGACKVITNLGRYQDSKHLHWHIISGEQKNNL